jgi:hypothetical protein
MTPTLRRLNDRERYWGMTWPEWFAAAAAAAVLYGAVKLSPFGVKPTVTIVVLLLAFAAMIVLGVSGQALSPGRHLAAIIGYRRCPKRWRLAERPDKRGLLLVSAPSLPQPDRGTDDTAGVTGVWLPGVLLADDQVGPESL